MSLNSKLEIWETLAREKFPGLLPYQLHALSMSAATAWYNSEDNELTELFDQYVMLKELKGLNSDTQ